MSEHVRFTRDTKFASCCCTLGIPLRREDPITRVFDGDKEIITYFFEGTSMDGRFTFEKVYKDWNNTNLFSDDPESPINYINAALFNRERLLDLIKKAQPLGMVQKGNKTILVSMNATNEFKDKLFRLL